ncbi:MAG: type I-B CRISPR-associated protein Cas8b1/Cst1 [Ardenticatenaceae bacterium]|nr:type I-B CRISPR-associated protein Cas8b1/Cst1 [Ardenticatenaceae bacterium]
MLEYTGHPLVDVGIATITAFAGKRDPAQVSEADLDAVADYIAREYVRQPLKSFLTVAFPNSGFTQPAFEKTPERRRAYAQRVLRGYRTDTPTLEERCVFTGEPAVAVAFGDKDELPLGRAFRQHIPLLTGEGVINFHPYGDAGLPVSGKALLAIQAFPLGCAKCGGRLLAVHSDNPALTLHFAAAFLNTNRQAVQLAQAAGSTKMPEVHLGSRTLLITTLLDAAEMQREAREEEKLFSLTAYHLSNSGQGPGLDIYHLPLQIIGFLRDMHRAEYRQAWNTIVGRAWEVAPVKKGRKREADDQPFQPRRNWLYEDLFKLPDTARVFLRTYLLREAFRFARADQGDPRGTYSLKDEAELVSWKVTERFLRRIMNMDKERIAQIRTLGDRLAEYVTGQNDRRFFRDFFAEQNYGNFRTALIKANLAHVRRGNSPIVTLDPYIEVFEDGDEVSRPDWRLARDLVLIRMVERLYEHGWLGRNADAIPESTSEDDSQSL